jgi:hypothetical protein
MEESNKETNTENNVELKLTGLEDEFHKSVEVNTLNVQSFIDLLDRGANPFHQKDGKDIINKVNDLKFFYDKKMPIRDIQEVRETGVFMSEELLDNAIYRNESYFQDKSELQRFPIPVPPDNQNKIELETANTLLNLKFNNNRKVSPQTHSTKNSYTCPITHNSPPHSSTTFTGRYIDSKGNAEYKSR